MLWLEQIRRREDGSATVESVLWIPFFVVLFMMIADVALIFHGQGQAFRIAQDANRLYSVGRFTSEAEAESYVETALAGLGANATADTTYDPLTGLITTVVRVPAGDLDAVGIVGALTSITMTITSSHVMEN